MMEQRNQMLRELRLNKKESLGVVSSFFLRFLHKSFDNIAMDLIRPYKKKKLFHFTYNSYLKLSTPIQIKRTNLLLFFPLIIFHLLENKVQSLVEFSEGTGEDKMPLVKTNDQPNRAQSILNFLCNTNRTSLLCYTLKMLIDMCFWSAGLRPNPPMPIYLDSFMRSQFVSYLVS